MLKVGLTGGIGSGKTTVAKLFEVLGIPVYYADEASKRILESDEKLISEIKKTFGDDVYIDQKLNRSRLATIVFNDPHKLKLLNELVHPPTIKDAHEWMLKQKSDYIIKEAALLFETGSVQELDYVIGVQSPKQLRIKRVMNRDSVSKEDVLQRMNRQIDEEIKMKLCDFIIYNDEKQLIIPQVLALHETLRKLSGAIV